MSMKRSRFYYKAPYPVIKTITFDGTSGKGAVGTFDLFTLTGRVVVVSFEAYCGTTVSVDGAGTASMQAGVENDTDLFIPTTQADTIDADEHWLDATPTANGKALAAANKDIAISQNIQGEVTTTDAQKVDGGVVVFTVWYIPSTDDGRLEAA